MAASSSIEWTESTWNPLTGCTKISPGCQHCYAERLAKRLQAMGSSSYANGFALTVHEELLELPLRWRKPRLVFVNSMSDLFHEEVSRAFIERVFGVMEQASWHQFQLLTKRSQRLSEMAPSLPWPPNVWMGVTVESEYYATRLGDLRSTSARVKFASLEPLLSPMPPMDLAGIDWVIVGGESGPKSRPLHPDWVRGVRDQCCRAGVPFFFKQWGGLFRKRSGRWLDGRTWDQYPRPSRSAASTCVPPS